MSQYAKNLKELLEIINPIIEKCSGNIVINAGHIMVLHDNKDDVSFSNILEEQTVASRIDNIQDLVGDFPSSTFTFGAMIAAHGIKHGKPVKMTILVNDWQFIKKDTKRLPSESNRYRKIFYDRFKKEPPETYLLILAKYGIDTENIWIGSNDEDIFFYRETRLRDRFKREAKRLLKKEGDQLLHTCKFNCDNDLHMVGDSSGNIYTKDSSNMKWTQIVEEGKANCAGELTQMIKELIETTDAKLIISFLPNECQNAVIRGTNIAIGLYQLANVTFVNIFPGLDNEKSYLHGDFEIFTTSLDNLT